jgi:hypothetical protein
MKKTYKNPTLTVVKLQPARILAGSDPKYYEATTTLTSGNHGRESRFSEYDEEEE